MLNCMKKQTTSITLILLIVLSWLCGVEIKAQTVGVYNQTIAVTPNYTLSNASTFSVTGSVVNTGNTVFSNNVHVYLAIDTSSTTTPKYALRSTTTYSVSNFAANQTFTFNVTDVGSGANGYKINGGGTTIIVWPVVGSITNTLSTTDTASTIIYITVPNNVDELNQFEESSIYIQNPTNETLNVKCSILNEPITIELINSNGSLLLSKTSERTPQIQNLTFNIQNFSHGIYYLRLYNKQLQKIITKKIIIN